MRVIGNRVRANSISGMDSSPIASGHNKDEEAHTIIEDCSERGKQQVLRGIGWRRIRVVQFGLRGWFITAIIFTVGWAETTFTGRFVNLQFGHFIPSFT